MDQKIKQLEENLKKSMISGDIEKLDELIDDTLVFISPNGVVIDKHTDLETHKSGILKISNICVSEHKIDFNEDLAIVTLLADIQGVFGEVDISGKYRYLRIWQNKGNHWKIISGSAQKI